MRKILSIVLGMMNTLYPHGALTKIFHDTSRKTIWAWLRAGLFEWVHESHDARGVKRFYSVTNLVQVGIVKELTGMNVPIDTVRLIMDRYFHQERTMMPILPGEPKPTLEESFSKVLVFLTDKRQRGWIGKQTMGYGLKTFEGAIEYLNAHRDLSVCTILNIKAIRDDILARIKEAGLD